MEIKKSFYIVFALVASIALIFMFILPKYQQSTSLAAELKQQQESYDDQTNRYETLRAAVAKIESNPIALEKINNALPPNPSFGSIVSFLQNKASEDGLIIKSINFSGAQRDSSSQQTYSKDVKSITFNIVAFGQYANIKQFLNSLDRSDRLFDVNTISFTSLQTLNLPSQQSYDFKLEIKTHSY